MLMEVFTYSLLVVVVVYVTVCERSGITKHVE